MQLNARILRVAREQVSKLICNEGLQPEEIRLVAWSIVMHTRGEHQNISRVGVCVRTRFVCSAAEIVKDAFAGLVRVARFAEPLNQLMLEPPHTRMKFRRSQIDRPGAMAHPRATQNRKATMMGQVTSHKTCWLTYLPTVAYGGVHIETDAVADLQIVSMVQQRIHQFIRLHERICSYN